jgi:hypothetical protein
MYADPVFEIGLMLWMIAELVDIRYNKYHGQNDLVGGGSGFVPENALPRASYGTGYPSANRKGEGRE